MIKTMIQKSSSLIIILLFGFVVYGEFVSPKNAIGAESLDIKIQESQFMYQALGGSDDGLPVTVFVTSWCPVCKSLQSDFEKKGLKFVQVDIEKNPEAMMYYQKVTQGTTRGVPVAVVGEQVFIGYRREKIDEAVRELKTTKGKSSIKRVVSTKAL